MSSRLHIIAPCANRKRLPIPHRLRLQSVRERDPAARARAWCKLLECHSSPTRPAVDLYAGDHWRVVRTLPDVALAAGYEAELWVLSAGYGLFPATAHLHAYSATFASGHQDSIAERTGSANAKAMNQAWWLLLSEWGGPIPGAVRSLQELARRDADASILIFGSPDYVRAVENDLLAAADSLRRPERLVVISSRQVKGERLDPYLIESDAALQSRLGGGRVSIHARVARLLLELARGGDWLAGTLRGKYQAIQPKTAPTRVQLRSRSSDEAVCRFIIRALSEDRRASATGLLRRLRQSGRACEQTRFKKLVTDARTGWHGA
jgi:hypothetical protein